MNIKCKKVLKILLICFCLIVCIQNITNATDFHNIKVSEITSNAVDTTCACKGGINNMVGPILTACMIIISFIAVIVFIVTIIKIFIKRKKGENFKKILLANSIILMVLIIIVSSLYMVREFSENVTLEEGTHSHNKY